METKKSLLDAYRFPGFHPRATIPSETQSIITHFKLGQVVILISKTRVSNWAQLMRARVKARGTRRPYWRCTWSTLRARSVTAKWHWAPQHLMEANEMESGRRHQGRQALEEFQRGHHEMSGAIAIWRFELQHDLAGPGAAEPCVAEGGTCDVATEPFEFLPLMGATPGLGRSSPYEG